MFQLFGYLPLPLGDILAKFCLGPTSSKLYFSEPDFCPSLLASKVILSKLRVHAVGTAQMVEHLLSCLTRARP
jgi:hypothetical protein